MTNAPSIQAQVGWSYDASGIQRFIVDSKQAEIQQLALKAAEDALTAAQQKLTAAQATGAASTKAEEQAVKQATTAVQQATRQSDAYAQAEKRLALSQKDYAAAIAVVQRQLRGVGDDRTKELKLITEQITLQDKLNKANAAATKANAGGGAAPALPRTFAGFTGGGFLQAAGAFGLATSVPAAIGKLRDLADESAALAVAADTIGTAFEKSTKRAGIASDDLLAKLREASAGTTSDVNLQLTANQAISLQVTTDAQKMADLLVLARAKGKEFGRSTADAFGDISLGIGRVSPKILDNIGLMIDGDRAYAAYAASIGKAADALTDQEKKTALVNDLIKQNKDLIEQTRRAGLDASDQLAKAETDLEAAKTRFGKIVLPIKIEVLQAGADVLSGKLPGLGNAGDDLQQKLVTTSADYKNYINNYQAVAGELIRTGNLLTLAFQPRALDEAAYNALRDKLQEVADAANGGAAATSTFSDEIAAVGDDVGAETQALAQNEQQQRLSTAARLEHIQALIKNRDALADATIKANDQLVAAETKRDQDLEKLDAAHAKRVQDIQDDITKTVKEAAGERLKIEQEGAKNLAEAEADIAKRDKRAAEDRARDAARDAAHVQQEESERYSDYLTARGKLLADQAERNKHTAEDEARALVTATREGQLAQYRSTADFLEKLYGLTRGRRNKGDLEAGRAALRAAQSEAAELAKTDPQAAAALLAERQRQIIANLERKREESQLRRDAKRSGRVGNVDQEIAEENAARKQADDLAIDAIKAAAREKAEQRARDKADQAASDQQAVADLDKNYTDQRDAARKAREQAAKEAAEDRAVELTRQREDDAARLADIKQATQDQLDAFDTATNEKLFKLNQALETEEGAYKDSAAAIKKTFDDLAADIQERLQKLQDDLPLTPDEKKVRDAADAMAHIGDVVGTAFAQHLQAAIDGVQLPTAGGGGGAGGKAPGNASPTIGGGGASTYTRGGVVGVKSDPLLSDQAVESLTGGAGKQTDGFNSKRGNDIHAGVDIAVPEGTPVKTPAAGVVLANGVTATGGLYTKVQTPNGDVLYFGHLSRQLKKQGDAVGKGDVVALSGSTGTAVTGPHLHFQLQTAANNGRAVDPTAYLEQAARGTTASGGAGRVSAQSYGGDIGDRQFIGVDGAPPPESIGRSLPNRYSALPTGNATPVQPAGRRGDYSTMSAQTAARGDTIININNPQVRTERDIDLIAQTVKKELAAVEVKRLRDLEGYGANGPQVRP